jgi:diguanylate cyclase (GGDEF)-like protein
MNIQRVSLQSLTVSILISLGLFSILLLFVTTLYFRDAALNAQTQSLSRVVEVATQEVLGHIQHKTFALGTTLQNRAEFRAALPGLAPGKMHQGINEVLNDPFTHGFSGTAEIDLVKLRVYNLDLSWLAESDFGIKSLRPQLDSALLKQVSGRQGAERLKAVGGLWLAPEGPLYSMLLPIGGLKITGYLEVVVNPGFNLPTVAAITRMPLKLYNPEGKILYQSPDAAEKQHRKTLDIEYALRTQSGETAYRLVSLDDVEQLNMDMARSGTIAAVSVMTLVTLSILLGLWFFNKFLFLPMRVMQSEMERSVQGDVSLSVGENALHEFHALASAFNIMAGKVADYIQQLQRLSCIDGLTGIDNRRQFDLSLQTEWLRAQRNGQELSLILLDIDYFKQYNDTYGHLAGDECLRRMGALLSSVVQRPSDRVARYGGEEFVVLLPDTSAAGIALMANKIAHELIRLDLPHVASALGGKLTVSMGCATCKVTGECTSDSLVDAADKALYRAKETGRNRFVAVTAGQWP